MEVDEKLFVFIADLRETFLNYSKRLVYIEETKDLIITNLCMQLAAVVRTEIKIPDLEKYGVK